MKKKALTPYIRCVRSMHMRSALYAEMMDTLGVSEQPEPVVQAKKESAGWLRFQRIAAVSVCLILCVTLGWFAFTVHENIRQMPVSPREQSAELYDLNVRISRAMKSAEYGTYSDPDNAVSWFAYHVKEQQDGLRSIMDKMGDPHNFQNYMLGPYIRSACEQIGIVKRFQSFQPENDERLRVIHYQYTAEGTLYALIANMSDETQMLDCDHVPFYYTGEENCLELHFRLPEYPHSWLAPYLSGTVSAENGNIAEIPPHSVLELCAVLADTQAMDPARTPRIAFYQPYDHVHPVISDGVSINWQKPDLPRNEETRLLRALEKEYEESETAQRIAWQKYGIPVE